MAPTILERGLPICGLRPNQTMNVKQVDDFSNSSYRSFETWFIFYKMDFQSNAKPSEKDHDFPGIQTRDLWISSQHCQPLHQIGASAACKNICGHLWHIRQSKRSTRPGLGLVLVLMYGSKMWMLTKREENRLLVY
jgi:hypothetical protein